MGLRVQDWDEPYVAELPEMATATEVGLADPVRASAPAGRYRRVSDWLAITPSVSVVIPAKNEAKNLPHVFATLPDWVDEIVLVDGHSVDGTPEVARQLRPGIKIVHQSGYGKGDALRVGFSACTGDIIVAIDADGSTDGAEIPQFVAALLTGADFAKGSRFAAGGGSDDITLIRRWGNRMLNALVNWAFGTRYTDLCYGYNAFWARHLEVLDVDCAGFEVETLMNVRAAKAGLIVREVPSHEHPRVQGVSNLRATGDGWRILKVIVSEWSWGRAARRPQRPGGPGQSSARAAAGLAADAEQRNAR